MPDGRKDGWMDGWMDRVRLGACMLLDHPIHGFWFYKS